MSDHEMTTARIVIEESMDLDGNTCRTIEAHNGDGDTLDIVRTLGLMQLAMSTCVDVYYYAAGEADE